MPQFAGGKINMEIIREIEDDVKSRYRNHMIFSFRYFDPLFLLTEKQDLNLYLPILSIFHQNLGL